MALTPSEPGFQFTLANVLYQRVLAAPPPRDWKPLRQPLKPLWPAAQT